VPRVQILKKIDRDTEKGIIGSKLCAVKSVGYLFLYLYLGVCHSVYAVSVPILASIYPIHML
jgi:hypothetical protein